MLICVIILAAANAATGPAGGGYVDFEGVPVPADQPLVMVLVSAGVIVAVLAGTFWFLRRRGAPGRAAVSDPPRERPPWE